MNTEAEIIRGIIEDYTSETRYDDSGMEYRVYTMKVNEESYQARLPHGIYLKEGMDVLLELDGKIVLSGYCIKERQKWGKHTGILKQKIGRFDRYEFLEGVVTEKKKTVPGSYDYAQDNTKISYTIFIDNHTSVQASGYVADKLKPGMEIAGVLVNHDLLLVWNKKKKKLIGATWPYYIPFSITFLLFNAVMYYLYNTQQTQLINYKPTLWVMNVFLVFGLFFSFRAYRKERKIKKFLYTKIR